MNRRQAGLVRANLVVIVAGGFLTGCAATANRNLNESMVVTASPMMADDRVTCALELRDRRDEFALDDCDAFLASERAANLSQRLRSEILQRRDAVRRTLPAARSEFREGLAITRPDPARPCADGNMVVYVAGKAGTRLLFSRDEIASLLELNEVADDLATLRYTHPDFEPKRLSELRDRVDALGLNVENTSFSTAELDQRKTAAAARIIERRLRELGVALPDGLALLTSGPLAAASSPKLAAALKDPAVMERIVRANDPDLTRALVRLARLHVVELSCP
jgi:hypothetical protein